MSHFQWPHTTSSFQLYIAAFFALNGIHEYMYRNCSVQCKLCCYYSGWMAFVFMYRCKPLTVLSKNLSFISASCGCIFGFFVVFVCFCINAFYTKTSVCICAGLSSMQYVTIPCSFSGVLVKTEADPLAELQWASADQSPTQRREGMALRSQIQRTPFMCLLTSLWHFISWLLLLCVSVWQRWLWQPGVQWGGRAQEKEDRGFESESVRKIKSYFLQYATFTW